MVVYSLSFITNFELFAEYYFRGLVASTLWFPLLNCLLQLFNLQLSDGNFRRYVLVQFLILHQYLTSQVKFRV